MDEQRSHDKATSKLIYSGVLLVAVFYAVRRLFFEWSLLWTTNVPWVESVLVMAALGLVGILAILALLGLLARALLKSPLTVFLVGISTNGRFRVYRERPQK